MPDFSLTSGATTQTLAAWKVTGVKRTRTLFGVDTVTFSAPLRNSDATPLFAYKSKVSLTDPSGTTWFVGIVTKIPSKASGTEDGQRYEVSGPWWYFEHLVFQESWMTTNGVTNALISTLRSMIILNQGIDLSLINLGDVATTVMNYVLSTAAAATPPFVPFQIGANTITTNIPFSEVKDKSCAQIMVTIFAWVPDAVLWFDYTTTPPTLNVKRRGDLAAASLAAFGGIVSEIDIEPCYELVVPAVVCKYNSPVSIDGDNFNVQTVDIYPVDAQDPAFDNLVLDLDLEGSNTTYQKQALKTTDRPKDYNAFAGTGALVSSTLAWLKGEHRADWLKGYTIPAGSDPGQICVGSPGNNTLNDITVNVDETKLTVLSVITTLVDNYTSPAVGAIPANTLALPTGNVPAGSGPGTATGGTGNALDFLGQELLEGSVTPWMTEDQNVYSARVRIEVTLSYTGDDPVIIALFGGSKFAVKKISAVVNVTNGSTQTYSQLASSTPPEPVPTGLAQLLYEGTSVLHYKGTVKMTEPECSGAVKINNTLNLTGSANEGWSTMAAQVFEITETIDNGETEVRLGPPKALTGQQWVDWLKASRGRVQSFHAQERATAQSGSDNTVQGAGTTALTGMNLPPSLTAPSPWNIAWRHGSSGFEIKVNLNSTIYNPQGTPGNVAVTGLDTWFTCTPAVSGGDAVWIEGTVASLLCTAATIHSIGMGNTDFDITGATASWDSGGKGDLVNDGGTPPSQTLFRRLIATIITDLNGNPVIQPVLTSNLILKNKSVNGYPAIYPEPYGS